MLSSLAANGFDTVSNTWAHLRNRSPMITQSVSDEAWFIGQDLAGNGYTAQEGHREYVNGCQAACLAAGLRFRYICHPFENPRSYPPEWHPAKFTTPIEWHLTHSTQMPALVMAAFSSALVSLRSLLPGGSRVAAVELDPKLLCPLREPLYRRALQFIRDELAGCPRSAVLATDDLVAWLSCNGLRGASTTDSDR
jgi:hypothetical protein